MKKEELNIYYDEEGDFLEFHIGDFTEGYFKNMGKGIFERIDKKTQEVKGFAIMGFKKRTEHQKEVKVLLPAKMHLDPVSA